jgi:hypothetical protein
MRLLCLIQMFSMVTVSAANLTGNPFYLENRTQPNVLSTTPLSGGDGFIAQNAISTLIWTTSGTVAAKVPAGSWVVALWTNSPGAASVVRVDILQGGASVGNSSADVNASGGGNHPTTFTIPINSALAFNNQTLGIRVTQVSGAPAQVIADGDFPSTLTYSSAQVAGGSIAGGSTTGSNSETTTATITSALYLEKQNGDSLLSNTALAGGDGFLAQALTVPLTWTTPNGLVSTVPAGSWAVTLWTNSPGAASIVRVDILQAGASVGNLSMDVNASGGGNHPTTFTIPISSAIVFNNQPLGIKITQVSGAVAQVVADGDFPSSLVWSSSTSGAGGTTSTTGTTGNSSSGGGAAAGTTTTNLFYAEGRNGALSLSSTALSSGDGFQPQSANTPLTWTTASPLTSIIPAGAWTVTLWTDSPGASSLVRVDVLQGGVSIGSSSMDVNASGGGNHITVFTIPITTSIAFSSQTLGLRVTRLSGAAAEIIADEDFPSTVAWTSSSSSTGGTTIGGTSSTGTSSGIGPANDGGTGISPATMTFAFNNTSPYPNSQVYVMIIGNDPHGSSSNMSWFNAATGKFQVMQPGDNNGIGSTPANVPPSTWNAGSKTYCPYSFTVAEHPSIALPWINSARIYYSYGHPVYMNNVVNILGNVMASEPGIPTTSDPNWYFPWDYLEFNWDGGGLNIDTTRVDAFCIPSNFTLKSQTGVSTQRGDLPGITHAQYVTAFQNYITGKNATATFGPCVLNNPGGMIVNAGSATIQAGQSGATYFDAYLDRVWSLYPEGGTNYFVLPIDGGPYQGQVNSAGQMVFTRAGDTVDHYYINRKPTTPEVISCAGVFNDPTNANGSTLADQLAVQAAMAATIDRTIADDPNLSTDWSNPATYYLKAPTNYYAAFWHINALGNLAYGFPYDDENSQSSDCNFIQPTTMTLNMWY